MTMEIQENEFIFVSEEAKQDIDVESVLPKPMLQQPSDEVPTPVTSLKLLLALTTAISTSEQPVELPILTESVNVQQQGTAIQIKGAISIGSFRKLLGLLKDWVSNNSVLVSGLGLINDDEQSEDRTDLVDACCYRLDGWTDVEVMETIVRLSILLLRVSS